jgi:single-strand DNA-binding protein
MINSIVLIGRLTKDPELRRTTNDIPVATFTLAVNRPFSNPNGEKEVDFIQCVVWRKQAENVEQYVFKGSLVGVEGRIQTRNYENAEGKTVYITEVVANSVTFLDSKKEETVEDKKEKYNKSQQPEPVNEDDLPF